MEPSDFLPRLNKTAQRHLEKVQKKIHYCVTCQPYEGSDYIWVFGERIELNDLFEYCSVPEKYRDDIAQHLVCPNCGRDMFERWEDVGLEDPDDAENRKNIRVAEKKYGKQIDFFQEHLKALPSLALSHPLGRKIAKEISKGNLPVCNVSGAFFRARIVKGSEVFDTDDMGAPPIGSSLDGRYHHAGQSVLYLSKDQEVAINEILESKVDKALVWVQEYEIDKIDNLLDLSRNGDSIGTLTSPLLIAILTKRAIDRRVEDPNKTWKPQYFITRFISDCARASGFQGILYSSTKFYGKNVVLFYPEKVNLKEKGNPKVLIYQRRVHDHFLLDAAFDLVDLY